MHKFALPIVFGLALAGCGRQSTQITLTPPAIEDCGASTKPVAITVHWDVKNAKEKDAVKVWLSNQPVPSHAGVFDIPFGTEWIEAGATGTQSTGPWIFPGTTITVTDAGRGTVLGQVRMPSLPCGIEENAEPDSSADSSKQKTG